MVFIENLHTGYCDGHFIRFLSLHAYLKIQWHPNLGILLGIWVLFCSFNKYWMKNFPWCVTDVVYYILETHWRVSLWTKTPNDLFAYKGKVLDSAGKTMGMVGSFAGLLGSFYFSVWQCWYISAKTSVSLLDMGTLFGRVKWWHYSSHVLLHWSLFASPANGHWDFSRRQVEEIELPAAIVTRELRHNQGKCQRTNESRFGIC